MIGMKKLLTILLLSLSLNSFSQIGEPLKVISVYSGSIILNAVGDGLNDSGNKTWGHACNAASIGLLVSTPIVFKNVTKENWYHYPIIYSCLRFSMFDYSYNMIRGLPFDYMGTTAPTDRVFNKAPAGYMRFVKGISFTVGIVAPITKLK